MVVLRGALNVEEEKTEGKARNQVAWASVFYDDVPCWSHRKQSWRFRHIGIWTVLVFLLTPLGLCSSHEIILTKNAIPTEFHSLEANSLQGPHDVIRSGLVTSAPQAIGNLRK